MIQLGWRFFVAAALTAVTAGCASPGASVPPPDSTRITSEELASVDVSTLYEVVQRLRPQWLEARGPRGGAFGGSEDSAVVVFMDRAFLGGVDQLRVLGPDAAAWLQHMTGAEAQAMLSGLRGRNVAAAIVLHTVERESR